jgi:ATP-dependent DNA helicase RecG
VKYPREVIHEIITNAAIHRDYSIADNVHVRIFDNRIEVESPGRLPAYITPKNILRERYSRNSTIVYLMNKFPEPPNKNIGEGLNTAFQAMNALQLKSPQIIERDHSVLVVIKHQKLGSPDRICIDYLQETNEIYNEKVRQLAGIRSENTAKDVLKRLLTAEIIEKIPGRNGNKIAYQRGPKFWEQVASLEADSEG